MQRTEAVRHWPGLLRRLAACRAYAHMMQEAIRRHRVSTKLANRFGERLEQMARPQPKSDLRVTIFDLDRSFISRGRSDASSQRKQGKLLCLRCGLASNPTAPIRAFIPFGKPGTHTAPSPMFRLSHSFSLNDSKNLSAVLLCTFSLGPAKTAWYCRKPTM